MEHYSKTCQNPKLDRNRQCFNEYTEVLGQGRVAVAKEKLAKVRAREAESLLSRFQRRPTLTGNEESRLNDFGT